MVHSFSFKQACCFLSYPDVHVHPRLQSRRWTMRSIRPLKLTTPASRRKPNAPQCSSTSPCTPSESQTWICAKPGKPLYPPGISPYYPPRNHISFEMGTCFFCSTFWAQSTSWALGEQRGKGQANCFNPRWRPGQLTKILVWRCKRQLMTHATKTQEREPCKF